MNESTNGEKEQNRIGLFSSVRAACDGRLKKWADYLSKKAAWIPEQKLARILITLFLILEIVLVYRLVYLYKHRNKIEFPSVRAPVRLPSYQPSADQTALGRIKSFHHYLDSIKLHNEPLYDSLMKKRPHLIDSMIIIERLSNE